MIWRQQTNQNNCKNIYIVSFFAPNGKNHAYKNPDETKQNVCSTWLSRNMGHLNIFTKCLSVTQNMFVCHKILNYTCLSFFGPSLVVISQHAIRQAPISTIAYHCRSSLVRLAQKDSLYDYFVTNRHPIFGIEQFLTRFTHV